MKRKPEPATFDVQDMGRPDRWCVVITVDGGEYRMNRPPFRSEAEAQRWVKDSGPAFVEKMRAARR